MIFSASSTNTKKEDYQEAFQIDPSVEAARIRQWNIWLIHLRWVVGGNLISLILLSRYGWNFPLNYSALCLLTFVFFSYNLVASILAQGQFGVTILADKPNYFTPFTHLQIVVDLVLLTAVLHFSGGVENPFIFCYIFHVAMGSILFHQYKGYLNSALAVTFLNFLIWSEHNGLLEHYHLTGLVPTTLYQNSFYLLSISSILTVTFFATSYMTSVIAGYLYQREMELEAAEKRLSEQSARCELSFTQLQALHKEKSEFMRKVAHELRAPLSAIQSCLQVALEYFGEQLSGKPRELIERAERRSGGLIDLVRDLLNLSRANEVIHTANFEPVDLGKILTAVIELAKPNAQMKQIKINIFLGTQDLIVKGDKGGLDEVFTNLVSNAVKYSMPNTEVQVLVETSPKEISISFRDQGIGIAAQDLPLLFSEFFRTGNAKAMQVEGTGLGLALSKKIVEIHGGTVSVTSDLGKGSCFTVKLPR